MNKLIALAAALLVNLTFAAVIEHGARQSMPLPKGEVLITDLSVDAVLPVAQTASVNRGTHKVIL